MPDDQNPFDRTELITRLEAAVCDYATMRQLRGDLLRAPPASLCELELEEQTFRGIVHDTRLSALGDDTLRQLARDPDQLLILFDEVNEQFPAVWHEPLGEAGGRLDFTFPTLEELRARADRLAGVEVRAAPAGQSFRERYEVPIALGEPGVLSPHGTAACKLVFKQVHREGDGLELRLQMYDSTDPKLARTELTVSGLPRPSEDIQLDVRLEMPRGGKTFTGCSRVEGSWELSCDGPRAMLRDRSIDGATLCVQLGEKTQRTVTFTVQVKDFTELYVWLEQNAAPSILAALHNRLRGCRWKSAEDFFQDACVELLRRPEQWLTVELDNKEQLSSLRRWLFCVAWNKLMKHFGRRSPEAVDPTTLDVADDSAFDWASSLIREETSEQVRKAVEELPEKEQTCVRKHFLEGKEYEVVGSELGVNKSTAQRRAAKGLRKITMKLQPA